MLLLKVNITRYFFCDGNLHDVISTTPTRKLKYALVQEYCFFVCPAAPPQIPSELHYITNKSIKRNKLFCKDLILTNTFVYSKKQGNTWLWKKPHVKRIHGI